MTIYFATLTFHTGIIHSVYPSLSCFSFPPIHVIIAHLHNSRKLRRQRREAAQKMRRALISARVLIQVQLVVCLGIPPFPGWQDLGDHASLPPMLIHLLCDAPRLLLLGLVVVENSTSVLRSNVRALTVRGRRVVHLVEEFEDGAVGELLRVVDDLECFGVWLAVSPVPGINLRHACL